MEARTPIPSMFARGSLLEALAATLPFLMGTSLSLLNLLNALHAGIPKSVGTGLALVGLTAFVIGLVKGLPRWSLPHTGMIGLNLSWILTHRGTFMGLNTRAGLLRPLLGWADRLFLTVVRPWRPWIVRVVLGTGWDWITLLGLTAIAVLLAAALRPLRSLYSRIREDWTLVSFGLYGATVMAVLYTFEDYPASRYPFMVASFLILALGAWVYMRGGGASGPVDSSRRALALFAAMVLAMIVGATGKAIIYASPKWPYPHSLTWYTEALSTAVLWVWVIAVILAPALLALLPCPDRAGLGGKALG